MILSMNQIRFRFFKLFWVVMLASSSLFAQNELDALRYNSIGITGTARAVGAGGAFSAVGADYSSAYLNPAGLALYRRSDFMLTPRMRFANTEAQYLDVREKHAASKVGFANVGYVGASRIEKWDPSANTSREPERGLKSYAFAVGVTQLANFNRFTQVSAYNNANSITDYYAGLASGQSYALLANSFGIAGSAWQAGLIDTSGTDGNYVPAALGGEMQQDITIIETGRINEWDLAGAINLDDKFYVGLSIGILDVKYGQELYHDESDVNDVHQTWANDSTPLAAMSYTDFYDVSGSGINAKLGVIFKPADFFRIGVSFQSPTVVSLDDEYIYEITGNFDQDPTNYGRAAESGTFSYNLTTPFKVTAGAMVLFRKSGFITADFEFQDYASSTYRTPDDAQFYDFRTENQRIRELFAAAFNFRLGGELRLNQARFRAGYALYGSILKSEFLQFVDLPSNTIQNISGNRHFVTAGIGYKAESFYIDLAYVHELASDRRIYYLVQDVNAYSPELIRRNSIGNLYTTIGFTF
jgi:long-subunit fatty acid transport protein